MIKSSELRLGNWVERITNNGQYVCYEKVKYIEGDYFGKLPSSDCHPIKLTAEILVERAGFNLAPQRISIYIKRRLQLWVGHNGCIAYLRHEDKAEAYWIGDCKHVHELQNLYFALSGEELPLNF